MSDQQELPVEYFQSLGFHWPGGFLKGPSPDGRKPTAEIWLKQPRTSGADEFVLDLPVEPSGLIVQAKNLGGQVIIDSRETEATVMIQTPKGWRWRMKLAPVVPVTT